MIQYLGLGEYFGSNLILWSYLQISIKVFAFMLDNATNNNTMIEGIQRRAELVGIRMKTPWVHLRCLPHKVHLAAVKTCY